MEGGPGAVSTPSACPVHPGVILLGVLVAMRPESATLCAAVAPGMGQAGPGTPAEYAAPGHVAAAVVADIADIADIAG